MEATAVPVQLPVLNEHNVTLSVKREDLVFPNLSGNKYRKLKYNLEAARASGHKTLITFGGAFSNHLHATAAAGKQYGFSTIGLVRGEELENKPLNPTLDQACKWGMKLIFLSRKDYKLKSDPDFLNTLMAQHGPAYLLPEGGTNELAVRGCSEILTPADQNFTHICCPVGTGGTLAGLARSAQPGQHILGYPALKAPDLQKELCAWISGDNWEVVPDYHFGGYGKINPELITFINDFKGTTGIPLDPVYTGKMLFGILGDVRLGRLSAGSRVLAIHTGGLQGIEGMNMQLKKKNLPLLHL
ncbi:1-aminocyclopropane-1-carboxylate deaminase/D-cysteine desulfhydrase [Robiginitalea sp.]|uniref:1-aminocyclopropane-1-carboxylate deaminase/D-cysteine desulfhydrase n=1 Tax=Robiginitalea sp. TaxID=1902411 RepID=UPI003C78789C